ncbi:uncharacterized protein LOC122254371 [Penaeus japonicus]|uniref:uncharacterized protein LOC122254371 n=1 Tax=Penaeus japonicus TaxID=27405 RepID=UPI001C715B24|nr:uncharacterized protein LOC122254371 [Penaeus japonicus]
MCKNIRQKMNILQALFLKTLLLTKEIRSSNSAGLPAVRVLEKNGDPSAILHLACYGNPDETQAAAPNTGKPRTFRIHASVETWTENQEKLLDLFTQKTDTSIDTVRGRDSQNSLLPVFPRMLAKFREGKPQCQCLMKELKDRHVTWNIDYVHSSLRPMISHLKMTRLSPTKPPSKQKYLLPPPQPHELLAIMNCVNGHKKTTVLIMKAHSQQHLLSRPKQYRKKNPTKSPEQSQKADPSRMQRRQNMVTTSQSVPPPRTRARLRTPSLRQCLLEEIRSFRQEIRDHLSGERIDNLRLSVLEEQLRGLRNHNVHAWRKKQTIPKRHWLIWCDIDWKEVWKGYGTSKSNGLKPTSNYWHQK